MFFLMSQTDGTQEPFVVEAESLEVAEYHANALFGEGEAVFEEIDVPPVNEPILKFEVVDV